MQGPTLWFGDSELDFTGPSTSLPLTCSSLWPESPPVKWYYTASSFEDSVHVIQLPSIHLAWNSNAGLKSYQSQRLH